MEQKGAMKSTLSVFLWTALFISIFVAAIPLNSSEDNSDVLPSQIVAGACVDFEPYEFVKKDSIVGFDVDVVNRAAEISKLHVEWRNIPCNEIDRAIGDDRIDIAVLAHTHERESRYIFTKENLGDVKLAIFTRQEINTTGTFDDLKWRTVAVKENSPGFWEIKDNESAAVIITVESDFNALEMLEHGDVAFALVDYHHAMLMILNRVFNQIKFVGEPIQAPPRGIAFKENEPALRSRFDMALLEMKQTGELARISDKWFGKGLVSDAPMRWRKVIMIAAIVIGLLAALTLLFVAWNRTLRISIKETTGELADSERFLVSVFNGISDGLSVLDKDLKILRVNDAMKKWYVHRGVLEGRKCHEVYHQSQQICESCPSVRTLKSGKPDYSLSPYIDEKGEIGIMDLFTSPLKDEKGEIVGVIEYVRIATEREKSRSAIEQARREWEDIFESISDPAMILDVNRRIMEANTETTERFPDITKKESAEKLFAEIFDNDDFSGGYSPWKLLISTGEPHTFESEIKSVGGWFLITIAPVLNPSGETAKVILIAKDITQRKLDELALKESENRFQAIIENAKFGIIMQKSGDVIFANSIAEEILGYTGEELALKSLGDIVAPYSKELVSSVREKYIAGEDLPDRMEVIAVRSDGKKIYLDIGLSLIPIKGERVLIFSFTDVTERKNLEEQLIRAQKMDAVGRLAGGIAHDFNNVLTAINGYCELMQVQLRDNEIVNSRVTQIMRATDRASSLVRQLLSLGRRQHIQPEPVDLNSIVRDVEDMLHRLLGENVVFVFNPAEKLDLIKADAGQIEQVILNIGVNARDAMGNKGKFTVTTSNKNLESEYCGIHLNFSPGKHVMIEFVDTGEGMDENTRRHAFDPFFSTKEVGKGSGLGLSIVYSIVKQFDGHILLYSEVGHGTSIKIFFPSAGAEKIAVKTEKEIVAEVRGGDETILVVEDDEQVREMIVSVLKDYGYSVLAAINGSEAVEVAKNNREKIRLVISDMVLPKLSGPEARDEIRKFLPDVKYLFISGYANPVLEKDDPETQILEIFQKPFTVTALAAKVRKVLDPQ